LEKEIKPEVLTASEDTDKSMRRRRRARQFMWVSAALLFVSLFAVIACTRLEWSRIFPYLMWNHVAVIAMVAYGTFAVRRSSRRSSVRGSLRPGELFARPILVVALIAAIVAIPNWGAARWDMGQASDGSIATSHHWHASSDDSRYFESFNRGPDREITKARYEQLNRGLYSIFARMWVLFSFIALMIWRFAALSSRDEIPKPDNRATIPTVFVGATGLPQWKSTALIAIIWTLVIGANLVNFAQGRHQVVCSMSIPPEMQMIVWVMPIAFFCVAALFMKRSPFVSPWIASLIDDTWGSGCSTDFMARLKPLLLFSMAGLIGSIAMVKGCWQDGQGPVDWTMPGFLLSGSVAFALVHLILRWRRVPGV
jgi:hypothetical protein